MPKFATLLVETRAVVPVVTVFGCGVVLWAQLTVPVATGSKLTPGPNEACTGGAGRPPLRRVPWTGVTPVGRPLVSDVGIPRIDAPAFARCKSVLASENS